MERVQCYPILRRLLVYGSSALLAGCSSLQIDVDVYKGPLTHERFIQVRQYASMAAAAKPLIREMYEKISGPDSSSACGEEQVDVSAIKNKRARFLCEVLQLYVSVDPTASTNPSAPNKNETKSDSTTNKGFNRQTQSQRATSRNPDLGLDALTFAVARRMASDSDNGPGVDPETNAAVDRLSEALILFAQRLVYVANNELLFSAPSQSSDYDSHDKHPQQAERSAARQVSTATQEDEEKNEKLWDDAISVLQALGNTILVHANDLRRQSERDELYADRAPSVSEGVQQAFQPAPSATVDGILYRLKRFALKKKEGDTNVDAPDATTPKQATNLDTAKDLLKRFRANATLLLSAYRTLFNTLPTELADPNGADKHLIAISNDFNAINELYSPANAIKRDGLKPLNDWLTVQTAERVITDTDRTSRLAAFKDYLATEQAILRAEGINDDTTRQDAMQILKGHMRNGIAEAQENAARLALPITEATKAIADQNEQVSKRLLVLAKRAAAQDEDALREKMTKVVRANRSAIIEEAENLGTRDPVAVTQILLRQLNKAKEVAATKSDKLNSDEIALTVAVIETFGAPKTPCHVSVYSSQCKGTTTIEVLDNLIAALRAQHIQAVAAGDEIAATNLLKAVNAAYDQRTAMIYLRPASDYLRSVYAATTLQDGAEDQYRNMLAGWLKNLRGNFARGKDARSKLEAKRELDKINWQNVNKVILSGGGSTNYVIAKDDVGNWYVKAYGSDPEAIIKSATSLALFNAGKGVNVNLLRRVEAQRRIDEDKSLSAEEREALRKEVGPFHTTGGQTLLKVRDRYAARYSQDTFAEAAALLAVMKEIPAKANARIAATDGWPGAVCTAESAITLLTPLEGRHLVAARDRLAATISDAATPSKSNSALLIQAEQNMQAGLTAMHLYSSDILRTLKDPKDAACDASEQSVAKLVREDVRTHIVTAATARRSSIERYEDALAGVLDIASEK